MYRLTELNTATKRFTYSYDLDNNITNIIAVNPKNKTNTTDYTYDTLDRLLSITGHIAEEDTVNTDIFTYDVV
ncbi:MAG: hypothetical protein LBF15_04620 [Candidatus Peribacteria bacterium]|nr:hypothetical protein [Candidatus Peribacteria bacterium]